ncbi:MAG TPA: phosphosulfolactate synthase [Bacteroidales bacterium]|nr:phosphosulfolactate synthase [Bacteroidales bacterium]
MNFNLPYLPKREPKPRNAGITMMMDKGLSLQEVEQFCDACGEFTDLVKFGFGTALITPQLEDKIRIYKQAGLKPYFGGTLFEMFAIRNMFDDFRKVLDKYNLEVAEISDGSMYLPHEQKLKYIEELSQQVTVLSEVGSKQAGVVIPPDEWVSMMKTELEVGAWKVIAEARESGTIGIYNPDGSANIELIDDIILHVKTDNVLWEAPNKNQQVWFIKLLGANVNLGNIATNDVIPLESLRLGLRGDTFFEFLPENYKQS